MTQLAQISELPLAEFSAAISHDDVAISDLRGAIELFTHKISVEQYGRDVVVADTPAWETAILRARDEGGMSRVGSDERIAHLSLVLLGRFGPDDKVLFLSGDDDSRRTAAFRGRSDISPGNLPAQESLSGLRGSTNVAAV